MTTETETPSYSDAMKELEAILARIEDDEIDLDDLANQVERASTLIKLCRGKLKKTEDQVTMIIAGLTEEES